MFSYIIQEQNKIFNEKKGTLNRCNVQKRKEKGRRVSETVAIRWLKSCRKSNKIEGNKNKQNVRMEDSMKIYYCFPGGKAKALTMSYDDGREEDIRLVDIFNKYGIKGTFNLNFGLMTEAHPDRVGRDKVAELYQGHEVATHCYTHPTIARCPLAGVAEEILEDRKGLESLVGYPVRGHAYPNGSYSEDIKDLFGKLGIDYGRVVGSVPSYELPDDPWEWHPTCHHNDPELMEKAKFFAEFPKKQYLKLMYVWGHSYEFTDKDNWKVIEEFCEYMGGREDIWYATNIEIIDYMKVCKNLCFTADCEGVYNPSAQSAWLAVNDKKFVEVKGGTFVNLAEA